MPCVVPQPVMSDSVRKRVDGIDTCRIGRPKVYYLDMVRARVGASVKVEILIDREVSL